jgi:hypothetical protein
MSVVLMIGLKYHDFQEEERKYESTITITITDTCGTVKGMGLVGVCLYVSKHGYVELHNISDE